MKNLKSELEIIINEGLNLSVETFNIETLDSLSVIKLIVALENSFNLSFEMSDINNKNFGSYESTLQYLNKRLNEN